MAFSYVASQPTTRDYVRFLIGDIDSNDPRLQDEEIDAELVRRANDVRQTVHALLEHLVWKYATFAQNTQDTASSADQQIWEHFKAMLESFDEWFPSSSVGGTVGPRIFAGGISVSDKATRDADTDRVRPAFARSTRPELAPPVSQP